MHLLRTARTLVGAGLCAVAHGLMTVGIACVGGAPENPSEPNPIPWEDEEDDAPLPPVLSFEHSGSSRAMVDEGMARREVRTVSAGCFAPSAARRR